VTFLVNRFRGGPKSRRQHPYCRPSLLETGAVGRVHGYKRGGYRGTNEVTPTPCLHDALPYPQQVSIHVHVGHCTITFYSKYGSSSSSLTKNHHI
jgi:hypothetical protein